MRRSITSTVCVLSAATAFGAAGTQSIGDYKSAYEGESRGCRNSQLVLTDKTLSWYQCHRKAFRIPEHNDQHLTIEVESNDKCPFGVVKLEGQDNVMSRGA